MVFIGVYEHGSHELMDIYDENHIPEAGNCVTDLNLEYYENTGESNYEYYIQGVSNTKASIDIEDSYYYRDGFVFINGKRYDDLKEAQRTLIDLIINGG